MTLKPASQIIIDSAHQLIKAHSQAPEHIKPRIAALMWEHLILAAMVEDMPVDELHTKLLISEKFIEVA